LYLLARNARNAQLAWSADRAATWAWSDWRFTNSFGCPTFLNFGKDCTGARDHYVYVYSPDNDSAYERGDRIILARVPVDQIRQRESYEFFQNLDPVSNPVWTPDLARRGGVLNEPGR